MTEQPSEIERLLNVDTPHRPASPEEAEARLAAARLASSATPQTETPQTDREGAREQAAQEDSSAAAGDDRSAQDAEGAASRRAVRGDPAERQLARLLGRAGALADALNGSLSAMRGSVEATDESGAVTVEVTGGNRVTRIGVAADWQRRVAAEALGAAVMQAITAAQLGAVNDALGDAADRAAAPPALPRPAAPPRIASAGTDWARLGRMFESLDRALDALLVNPPTGPAAAGRAAHDVGEVVGRSANRRVTVVFVAGRPTAVEVDADWAVRTGRQQLAESLMEAFQDAQESAEADRQAAAREGDGTGTPSGLRGLFAELQEILEGFGAHPGQDRDGDR